MNFVALQHVGSFCIKSQTLSCIGRWILYHWATREAAQKAFDLKRQINNYAHIYTFQIKKKEVLKSLYLTDEIKFSTLLTIVPSPLLPAPDLSVTGLENREGSQVTSTQGQILWPCLWQHRERILNIFWKGCLLLLLVHESFAPVANL